MLSPFLLLPEEISKPYGPYCRTKQFTARLLFPSFGSIGNGFKDVDDKENRTYHHQCNAQYKESTSHRIELIEVSW